MSFNRYYLNMKNSQTFLHQISDMFKSVRDLPEWALNQVPVPKQIRLIREALGMTQKQLAGKIHTVQSAVAQMENGSDFQISTLRKIAKALNCELLVSLVPKQEITALLDELSTEKAKKLVSASSGNAAMELQSPEKKYVELEIREMKEQILRKNKKILWEK